MVKYVLNQIKPASGSVSVYKNDPGKNNIVIIIFLLFYMREYYLQILLTNT